MNIKLGMPTITEFILYREKYSMTMKEIQNATAISEADIFTLELSYQCYLKNIPLDYAIFSILTDERVETLRPIRDMLDDYNEDHIIKFETSSTDSANIEKDSFKKILFKDMALLAGIIHQLKKEME